MSRETKFSHNLNGRMKFFFLQITLMLSFFTVAAQGIHITGCIKDLPYNKAYLAEIISGRMHYIDSVEVKNQCCSFFESDSLERGIYNIVLNEKQNSFIRILLNGEKNIAFSSSMSKMAADMKFTGSLENELYQTYNILASTNTEKSDLLQKLIAQYPAGSDMSRRLKAELNGLNEQNKRSADDIVKNYPGTLAAAVIRAQQNIEIPAGKDTVQYLKEHLLDQLDFSNTSLLRSGMLASGILKYLSLSEDRDYTYDQQVESYVRALDNILRRSAANDTVYGRFRTELTGRYRYGNYDILGAYLTKYYTGSKDSLPPSADITVTRERLASLHHVSQGVQAPEIIMPTYDGKTTDLADIQSKYTLLVFWSTGCYHCTQTLPELKKIYDKQRGHSLEVLAVSFDTDKAAWQDFIKKENFSWINYSDLKGWQSDIAKTYDIQGTPTYILLDKGKKVICKPATLEELFTKLHALNVI